MKKFLQGFFVFIRMYRKGFFFSESSDLSTPEEYWGFWRFNYKDVCAIYGIDFAFRKEEKNFISGRCCYFRKD